MAKREAKGRNLVRALLTPIVLCALGSAASAQSFYSEIFYNGDSRGYSGEGDWAFDHYKGECNAGDPATGISALDIDWGNSLLPHGMLCTHGGNTIVNSANFGGLFVEQVHSLEGGDDRADFGTGTWDSGANITLAECAQNEAIIGISERDDGSHKVTSILCSFISNEVDADDSRCYVLPFSLRFDLRTSGSGGDWDVDTSKNQCRDTEFLKGVSANNSTGELSRLLCCPVQPDPH